MIIKGSCGNSATYEFNDENGVLVISGSGAIEVCAFDANIEEETEKAFISDIKTVVIEEGITEINKYAFYGCKNLTNITIPNSVMSIGWNAFSGSKWLKNYSDDLVIVGNGILYKYKGSDIKVTIPDGVTTISYCAFDGCKNLVSVKLPDSITRIENYAFYATKLKTKKKAYKAFNLMNNRIFCNDYEYKENKWSETLSNIKPCKKGYHYCNNLFNIFNHYRGEIDKDIAIYECEVGDTIIKHGDIYVTNRIKPIKRLYREDVIRILNGGE